MNHDTYPHGHSFEFPSIIMTLLLLVPSLFLGSLVLATVITWALGWL